MRSLIVLAGYALLCCWTASSETYLVRPDGSGDFPTIQAAIDGASDGDTILLASGVFSGDGNRDIDFVGKAITVGSEAGHPDSCLLDCQGAYQNYHRGFHFTSDEGPGSIIQGITIANGYVGPTSRGGGIYCETGTSPIIRDCVIRSCLANDGGGIFAHEATPAVEGCVIEENEASSGGGIGIERGAVAATNCTIERNIAWNRGGGVESYQAEGSFEDCTISDNYSDGKGGGFYFYQSYPVGSHYALINCTLVGNIAGDTGGGIRVHSSTAVEIVNTIVAFTIDGGAVRQESDASVYLVCCDIYGNAGGDWVGPIAGYLGRFGNISLDPCFCDQESDDYHLWSYSPCDQAYCGLIGAWPVGCWSVQDSGYPATQPSEMPGIVLQPSAPNPFSDATRIAFSIHETEAASSIALIVCDAAGRIVRTLIPPALDAGMGTATWDGRDDSGRPVEAGAYFCRFSVGRETASRRVLLVR